MTSLFRDALVLHCGHMCVIFGHRRLGNTSACLALSQSTGHSRQLTTVSHHCPHGNDGWTLLCPTWSPGIAEALPGETVSTHAPGDPRSVPFPTATPRLRPQAPAAAHAPCCPPSGTANHHSAPTIPTQGFPDPRGRQVPKAQTTHFRKFGFSGTSQARLLSAAAGPSGPPGWSLPGPTSEPEAPGLGVPSGPVLEAS